MDKSCRALHYVFKVGDRSSTMRFFREVLAMKVLRHEEFEEGCKATCNGPYDGKWSKTMVGYGSERDHFVMELTYNYGIAKYRRGNDFKTVVIHSRVAVANAVKLGWPCTTKESGSMLLEAPGGYPFLLLDKDVEDGCDPVRQWTLSCSDLSKSLTFWSSLLGMTAYEKHADRALLRYSPEQASLELVQLSEPLDRGTAFGRTAIACPTAQLGRSQKAADAGSFRVVTPLLSLDTPGKATVQVVILGDPDGHEVCLVGSEAFDSLSDPDPNGAHLLEEAILSDQSDVWFAKKGGKKEKSEE